MSEQPHPRLLLRGPVAGGWEWPGTLQPAQQGQEKWFHLELLNDGRELSAAHRLRPDYAAERIENAELRQELTEEGQGAESSNGGMERKRVDPEISRLAELAEAHRTGMQTFGGIYGGGPDVPQAGEHSPAWL